MSSDALKDTPVQLSPSSLRLVCTQLAQRSQCSRSPNWSDATRNMTLDTTNITEITDFMVSIYTEGALSQAASILRVIGCNAEAERLETKDLVLMTGDLDHCAKSSPAHPKDSLSASALDSVVANPCVKMMSHTRPAAATPDHSTAPTGLFLAGQCITGNVHQPQPLSRSIPHVVQKHVVVTRREQRIHLVSDVKSVLDELFTKGVIHQESYDKICALPTSEEKMMALLDGYVISDEDKDIFFNIVEKCIPLIHNQGPRFDGLSASADVQSAGGFRKVVKKCKVPEDHWIKLEPEGICLDEEDTLIYRDKVSLKYQFGSWEEQMERMEAMQFIPGGPLLDVTFIAGILDEAYLPHWICTEDNPDILGKFAVLHIDTCGDVVEQLSEVTPSHFKLSQPVFLSKRSPDKSWLSYKNQL
ncbi:uncharacterized protein LOC134860140 [Eleginops maclovinus]|uniref:uncharacterized protein LOC134860140 n=1 Tax=Eleginops maclovinus TaxID=56733 RepID=UPI00307FED2C